jgi:hypothetical protein
MYRTVITLILAIVAVALLAPNTQAQVSAGITLDKDGIRSFHLAIGDHFGVVEKEVAMVVERNVPEEELPVVFFLAKHAGVAPSVIVKLRLSGKSWMEITHRFGLTVDIFYVHFDKDPGPPYGNAWGHFKEKKKSQWKSINLVDVDIVNLVNLKFISERHGYTPTEIVKLRAQGHHFAAIHKHIKTKKEQKNKNKAIASSEKPQQGKGKGKKK